MCHLKSIQNTLNVVKKQKEKKKSGKKQSIFPQCRRECKIATPPNTLS